MAGDHYYPGPPGEMTHHYVPPASLWPTGLPTSLTGPQSFPVATQPYVPTYFPPWGSVTQQPFTSPPQPYSPTGYPTAIVPPPTPAPSKPTDLKVGEWIRISQCPKCGMPHWCRPADDAAASPETVKTCSCGFY